MRLDVITPPAAKPMDVADARAHVRQELNVDDVLLDADIRACRRFAQTECRRTLIATRYRLTLDAFPCRPIPLEMGPVLGVLSVKYLDTAGAWQTLATTVYAVDLSGPLPRIALAWGQAWPTTLSQIGAVRIEYDAGDAAAITADASTDIITIKGGIWRTLAVNDVVRFSNSGGVLPRPLLPDTDYYVQSLPSASTMKVSTTSSGSAINILDAGTGTHYIGAVPEDVLAWMRLRIGGLYDNRADAIQAQGGQMLALPYVDRLLDGSRIWG